MKKTALEKWIMEVEKLPELNRELLEKLQLERLNSTLQLLVQRGGIYADYPSGLHSLDELGSLPFTTAQMLADKPGGFLRVSQAEVSRVISGATSGTTGLSKRVFYTDTDMEHTVNFFAAGISEMLSAGEKCLIAFPFSGPFGLGDLIARAVERLGAIPVKAGYGQSWGELCRLISETQPETYIGFPAALLSAFRAYGDGFPIRRALVSGDACPEGVQLALEKALGSRLYPHYGSRECGLGGAVTCPAFEGMHLRENHIIADIIDEQGNVLPEGEFGELVITTVGLEAMPLIRYRTGDFTRILPPCPCGGVTKRLDRVSRKEGDISIERLDSVLFGIEELVDYKAAYDGTLNIRLSVNGSTDLSKPEALVHRLYPELKTEFQLKTFSLDDRPMYPGKRYIIR